MISRPVTVAGLKKRYDQEKHQIVKQRILMIIHVKKGKSARQTAEMVIVDKNTVVLWCTRFNELGFDGLKDEARPGKPKKVDYGNLQNALDQSPQVFGYKHQAWHPKLVEIYLLDYQNLKLSKNYVYKLIRKLGFSLKVPRTRSYKSDPKKVLAFKKNEASHRSREP